METKINWKSAVQTEILQRTNAADYFFRKVLNLEISEYFVSDKSSLADFDADDTQGIIDRIHQLYGTHIKNQHYRIPLWELLNELEATSPKRALKE